MADKAQTPNPALQAGAVSPVSPILESSLFSSRIEKASRVIFWVYWLAINTALSLLWTHLPDLHHGDSFSDANVINAGRNFDRVGMRATCGLPVWWSSSTPDNLGRAYTHYPPGPEWIHQGLKCLGFRELWQWRQFSILVAGAAIFALWKFANLATNSSTLSLLFVVFYSFSTPFTQFADSVHQHAYMQLSLFGCLAAWCGYEWAAGASLRRLWLALASLFFFLDLWLTFEHVAMIPVFVAGRALFLGFRRHLPAAMLMACVFCGALASRVFHNSLILGSTQAAVMDLFGAARYRSAVFHKDVNLVVVAERWKHRLGGGDRGRDDHDSAFQYPVLKPQVWIPCMLLAPFLVWGIRRSRQLQHATGTGLLLLLAGLVWFLLMKEHVERHRHVVMLLLPGLALMMAALAGSGMAVVMLRSAAARLVGGIAAAAMLGIMISELRHSRTVNSQLEIHPGVYRTVQSDMRYVSAIREIAAPAMKHSSRVYFVGRAWPEQACAVGAPFEFVEAECPLIQGDEAIWIESWTPAELRLAAKAAEVNGPGERLPPPLQNVSIFLAGTKALARPNLKFKNGITMREMTLAPSILGATYVIGLRFQLPAHELPLDRIAWVLRTIHRGGDEVGKKLDVLLSDNSVRHGSELIQWIRVDSDRLKGIERLRVGLTTIEGTPIHPEEGTTTTLPGLNLSGDGWSYLLELQNVDRGK